MLKQRQTEEWSSRNRNRILKRADTESRNGRSEEAETREQQIQVEWKGETRK